MINTFLKIQKLLIILVSLQFYCNGVSAQYKTFVLTAKGDTINAVDKKGLKQGKWIVKFGELRGEPGYEDEGIFKNDKKVGRWRRYNLNSDLLAVENYRFGGKEGQQQYFTMQGELVREESWRAYNPDAPYDTIAIYSNSDNNMISEYKIVKAEPYSVKDGEWKYYDPTSGRLLKSEVYERGTLRKDPVTAMIQDDKPKKKIKPKEVMEFEKKNSGKKKVKLREGQTGY